MKRQNSYLQEEIAHLNKKLEESLAGLQAATRLGDQVETKTAQINDLKEQGKIYIIACIVKIVDSQIYLCGYFYTEEINPMLYGYMDYLLMPYLRSLNYPVIQI